MDQLLISLTDIKAERDISPNMDNVRIEALINKTQVIDLSQFLGAELYLLLINDYDGTVWTTPKYDELFNGKDYNGIRYYGLKPMLIHYTWSRILEEINLSITRAGARMFDAEESEAATSQDRHLQANNSRSEGLVYQNGARVFLEANKSVYPEWYPEQERKTSFKMWKTHP